MADVRLRAPIVPKKFFHTAGNFADHHAELQAVDWSHPVHKGIVFFQNVDAIIGPDDAIVYPEGLTKELDYELELAIVIGRSGKFFGPDEAADYIAGYTVFNDAQALAMGLRVNGQVRQRGNTAQMLISLPHLVAYHSAQGYSVGVLRNHVAPWSAAHDTPPYSTDLSGLALAQGQIKDGHTCEVFERDADDSRKIGYYLHMNADGGEALRRYLPDDLFELYAQTSRLTYDRRESIVLDDQLNELSSQPHLGPPNSGDRPHTASTAGRCARFCGPGWATPSTPATPSPGTRRRRTACR